MSNSAMAARPMKILIVATCFVSFGASLASAQATSAPPQNEVDHCRSLPLTRQWGCFRDLETRLKSAAPQPAPMPAQQTRQKPAAAASPKPPPTGGSEELRD
jgi:hypothetical protein